MLSSVAQFSVELKTIRGHGDKHHIFAPALALFPSALARDITTFPLCNTNQITMEYLKSTRDCAPKSYYCAVFALDPFIDWEEFSALLHAAEFHGICNFPTIPDFDDDKFEMLILYSSSYQLELCNRIIGKGNAHHCHVDRIADFSSCYDTKQC
jgi:predicted TIM-barrel enzyme